MSLKQQYFSKYLAQTSPKPLNIEIEKAEGIYMFGPDGKPYIDLVSGVSVSNIGHNNPVINNAVRNQLDNYSHLMVYGELVQGSQVEFAKKLASSLPENLQNIYFVNSGSEAVEGAMKLAKRHTGRTQIISFKNAYHGSTQGSLSILGDETFKNAFRPLLPDILMLDFNNFEMLDSVSEKTACVVMEVVQSEAGVVLPTDGFIEAVAEKCKKHNTLLIFDECQTAFYRTGNCYAFEQYKVFPDILILAKALGGGFPLGAFVSSKEIMQNFTYDPVLGHITTFGGHPVCCAAGMAAFDFLNKNFSKEKIEKKSNQFYYGLINHAAVKEIRKSGLLMAVDLGDEEKLQRFISLAVENGIISDWFLFCNTAFRVSPPLTITKQEIELCISKIIACLDRL